MDRLSLSPAALAALLWGVCSMAFAAPTPVLLETRFPTDDHVIASAVLEPGAEKADAAPAIQAAIDELKAAGGGVVFLRPGRYLLATPLVVRESVTVRGDSPDPRANRVAEGTLLMPTAHRGTIDGPAAITLERGSGIRDLGVWYPEQRVEEIVPYPWTIHTSTEVGGDNYTVENVTLVNAYLGIGVGPEWNELHTVRNVYGTALQLGAFVDTTTDIGRLSRVRFSPQCWEDSGLPGAPTTPEQRGLLRERLLREAVAYEIGRSDWEYLYRVEAEGYGTGMLFRGGAQGTTNAQTFAPMLEGCRVGIELRELNGVGLMVTGGRIQSTVTGVLGLESLRGTCVQFQACEIGSREGDCVHNAGASTFTFQNCAFQGWAGAAIRMDRGALGAIDCTFGGPASAVVLGESVGLARILGSGLTPDRVAASCDPRALMLSREPLGTPKADTSPAPVVPTPHPARRALFVVTDHGASPDAADNTGAFQAALDAAGEAGGGTVYVPAGYYTLAGTLRVPTGVELRGIFDVPHHTISAGSVLRTTAGRGEEDGTPFLQLAEGSGARGLTIWYPEQDPGQVQPYPWAIRGLGPRCWVVDVTIGNGYQGVDFATNPSDGHLVRYLAGGFLKRGLFVSKASSGVLEDVMYNPHYMARLPQALAQGPWAQVDFDRVIRTQRENLWGIALGSCADEYLCGTFLYAAYAGLALYDDNGGPNARIIGHGTDTGSCGVLVQATGGRGVDFLNAQLVPLSHVARGAVVTDPSFSGRVRFFNTQVWAGDTTAALDGPGEVLLQQMNTLTGPVRVRAGACDLTNATFAQGPRPHVEVGAAATSASLTGNLTRGLLTVDNGAGERTRQLGNATPALRRLDPNATYRLATSWEPGEPTGADDVIADPGGGIRSVSAATCRVEEGPARTGSRSLHLGGNADDPAYSFVYFRVLEAPVALTADSELRYWIRPENELGRYVGIDLILAGGGTLRQAPGGVHPGAGKGPVGEWSEVVVPLGALEGRWVEAVMLAYDSRAGGGPFETRIDDLSIGLPEGVGAARVTARPPAGFVEAPTAVVLECPEATRIRYTLDGSEPDASSPVYEGPVALPAGRASELRCYAEDADGRRMGPTTVGLWEVGR